jgi:hypothetical protein
MSTEMRERNRQSELKRGHGEIKEILSKILIKILI